MKLSFIFSVFQTKRQLSYQGSGGPGAGLYALPGLLSTRKDFNKAASTSSFHQPIAQPSENVDLIPAPNEYNVSFKFMPALSRFSIKFYAGFWCLDFIQNEINKYNLTHLCGGYFDSAHSLFLALFWLLALMGATYRGRVWAWIHMGAEHEGLTETFCHAFG